MLELTVHVLLHSIRHPTSLSASVAALSTDLSPIRHFLDYYGNLTGATQEADFVHGSWRRRRTACIAYNGGRTRY